MKILILGAKGNLGGQLAKVFSEDKSNQVIAWDRGEVDITDKELVSKKVKDIKPKILINCAAYNAVDKCEENETEQAAAYKLNGEAVGFLAEAALANKSIFIHYSSDYVFGGRTAHQAKTLKEIKKQGGFREDDEPRPINQYGQTKLAGEQEIIKRSGRGLKWYLIRTSKLFGPKGESETAKPNFFELMLKLSREKKELEAVNDEVSCFTYTPDLARATAKLAAPGKGYGIYHLTNSGADSWYEAAKELFRLADVKIKIKPVAAEKFIRPARRPKYSVLLNTKLPLLRSWQEALEEFLKEL